MSETEPPGPLTPLAARVGAIYPCDECGKMRTKAEGGTVFTVCDACWDTPPRPVVRLTHDPERGCEDMCPLDMRNGWCGGVPRGKVPTVNSNFPAGPGCPLRSGDVLVSTEET